MCYLETGGWEKGNGFSSSSQPPAPGELKKGIQVTGMQYTVPAPWRAIS
jgi:hypothetical protein